VAQAALLDSAVATFSQPYLKEAAPYLLARAQMALAQGRYRGAFLDLNEYETLMRSRLNANFYYMRYQACVGGRLFQQGINDISKAIELQPKEPFYYSEKASLEIRVGLYADAVETARQLIQLAPEQSDGYLFLGLAQCLSGNKTEGLKNMEKARDMGDPQAADLISRYAK
jgi:tetratricopeptide (TPR) repeat protein